MAGFDWTDELRADVLKKYLAGNPTEENTSELTKSIADELGATQNGVRIILVKTGDYVKGPSSAGGSADKKDVSDKPKKLSKADAQKALIAIIEKNGGTIDEAIIEKLTGKAADYLTSVFTDLLGD